MNSTKRAIMNAPKSVDAAFMDAFLGRTVDDFCPTGKEVGRFKVGDSDNHCAHFVSHVLGFRFGELCLSEKWHGDGGRTMRMRVDELFMWCTDRGLWSTRPVTLDPCLIFATVTSNVTTPGQGLPTFGSAPRKHVGIWTKGFAYNYHNGARRRRRREGWRRLLRACLWQGNGLLLWVDTNVARWCWSAPASP